MPPDQVVLILERRFGIKVTGQEIKLTKSVGNKEGENRVNM